MFFSFFIGLFFFLGLVFLQGWQHPQHHQHHLYLGLPLALIGWQLGVAGGWFKLEGVLAGFLLLEILPHKKPAIVIGELCLPSNKTNNKCRPRRLVGFRFPFKAPELRKHGAWAFPPAPLRLPRDRKPVHRDSAAGGSRPLAKARRTKRSKSRSRWSTQASHFAGLRIIALELPSA